MNSFRHRSRAHWRCVRLAFALAALGTSPVSAAPSFVIEDGACDTAAMARHLARLAETPELETGEPAVGNSGDSDRATIAA